MKELLLPIEKNLCLPKYQILAEGLRTAIRQGKLRPGEKIPSTRDLARRFQMHRHTVMRALAELSAEGWIYAEAKKYFQVTETLPETFLRPQKNIAQNLPEFSPSYNFARPLAIGDYVGPPACKYAFPSGFPDLRLFPMREFKSHLFDALKNKDILCYGDPIGQKNLLDEIAMYLRRVRSVDDRSLVVTNGSQEAIFMLAQLIIRPGDTVAVEALGYPPAMEALRFAGAKLIPIRIDAAGLDINDLEAKIKKHRIKALYITPLHQYPTTVTLSAERRLKLYELCLRGQVLILEDDYDHEFHYVSQPVAPLASFDPAGIVLYISTFSKVLFPSARLGFAAVPPAIAKELAKLKRISSRQNEQILQDAIARWMISGDFERHLRKMRRHYAERCNSMLASITKLQEKYSCNISWVVPDGGMALWLDIQVNAEKFAEKAFQQSIAVNPEARFRLDGKAGTHLRLGFSGQTPAENHFALEKVFALLAKCSA